MDDIKQLALSSGDASVRGGNAVSWTTVDHPTQKGGTVLPAAVQGILTLYTKRFSRDTNPSELARLCEAAYDKSCMFENNFTRTYSVDFMLTVWRMLASAFTHIEVDITSVTARVITPTGPPAPAPVSAVPPPPQPTPEEEGAARGSAGAAGVMSAPRDRPAGDVPVGLQQAAEHMGAAAPVAGEMPVVRGPAKHETVLLEIESRQRWFIPGLLLLVKWMFGPVMHVKVKSTLTFGPSGRIIRQQDKVLNWLQAPMPVRFLTGLYVPAISTVTGF